MMGCHGWAVVCFMLDDLFLPKDDNVNVAASGYPLYQPFSPPSGYY